MFLIKKINIKSKKNFSYPFSPPSSLPKWTDYYNRLTVNFTFFLFIISSKYQTKEQLKLMSSFTIPAFVSLVFTLCIYSN